MKITMDEQNDNVEVINDSNVKEKINYGFVLKPLSHSIDEVVKTFKNINNYGIYVSNMRNNNNMKKEMEDYFGPSSPPKKKYLEKVRGQKFPIKTKASIDELVIKLSTTPNILCYELSNNSLVFLDSKNPSMSTTAKIIDTVLKNSNLNCLVKHIEINNI